MKPAPASPLRRVMIDLETYGTQPGCIFWSIGAVVFDEDGVDPDHWFYEKIELESAQRAGLKFDADTVRWWMRQSDAARAEMDGECQPLAVVLSLFASCLAALGDNVQIWSNGFDASLLEAGYAALGQKAPWDFYNERCFRTFKKEFPVPPPESDKTGKHHALKDARHQAEHAVLILRHLRRCGALGDAPAPARPKASRADVDDRVAEWHEKDGQSVLLFQYLGWTEAEHARWVQENKTPEEA